MKPKVSKAQVLITGVYRTGSEFFTHLLNSFSEVSASMYRVNLLRFIYKRYCPINSSRNLERALDDLNIRLKQRYSIDINKENFLSRIDLESISYGELYDQLMTFLYLENSSALIWAEKCQLVWRESSDFIEIMKNGKVILIHRDPRSILASFKHYTNAPKPRYLGAIFNSFDAMQYGLILEKKYPSKFLNIRYEDLILNELFSMEKVAKFLNLTNEAYNFKQEQLFDAYGKPWISNSSFQSNEEGVYYDKKICISRWKEVLSKSEVELTEKICSKMMAEYGYEPSLSMANDSVYNLLKGDHLTESYLMNFLTNGEGIQAFPSDPLNSINWEKN